VSQSMSRSMSYSKLHRPLPLPLNIHIRELFIHKISHPNSIILKLYEVGFVRNSVGNRPQDE
jgi:hypothetical protein